jgi:hypothetical protein
MVGGQGIEQPETTDPIVIEVWIRDYDSLKGPPALREKFV